MPQPCLMEQEGALENIVQTFGMSEQTAKIDGGRRTIEPDPAISASDRFHEPGFGEILNDFHQVVLGDVISVGDLSDRTDLSLM